MNPKLKENIWRIDNENQLATLITSSQAFDVPFNPALAFLKIRPLCTGHHSLESIAQQSALSEKSVQDLLRSLQPSGIIISLKDNQHNDDEVKRRENIVNIIAAWSTELAASYIGNELGQGQLSKTVLVGWLLEMYHYIKDFPKAIHVAAQHAPILLRPVYEQYCTEETGHEIFVLNTLLRLGLSQAEVESSAPLVSTRSINLLMKELFTKEPIALLIVAALIEAQEFNSEAINDFKRSLVDYYGVTGDALDSYFEHQEIDVRLGHADLLASHIQWLDHLNGVALDAVLDGVHDIKHAFDLQSLEIKHYYGSSQGQYIPRQTINYTAIR